MNLFLANPWGLLALLSIPAIIAVHLFQRRARQLSIATSFLLEEHALENQAGRKLSVWRHSWAFWLQILAAIILSLLLAQPRWLRTDTEQRVALVLDASASMQAFRAEAEAAVRDATREISGTAGRIEWLLRDSRPEADRLYGGDERSILRQALPQWTPTAGAHPLEPALSAARLAVGPEGRIIFVTDHKPEGLSADVEILAVGEPKDNVGIAGVSVSRGRDGPRWRAIVRNYADTPQERSWWVETTEGRSEAQTLALPPDAVVTLSGAFPGGADTLTLRLSEDALSLDDTAPMVVPRRRPIAYRIYGDAAFVASVRQVMDLLPETAWDSGAAADLALAAVSPGNPRKPGNASHAMLFGQSKSASNHLHAAQTLMDRHPLVTGLSFDGLVFPRTEAPFEASERATVLVWDGETPLIFLEPDTPGQILVFNFDVAGSNLERLPAFVVLVNRFVESIRQQKLVSWRENFEVGQTLPVPANASDLTMLVGAETQPLGVPPRAPEKPALFTLQSGGETVLRGATQFLDVREADLRGARASNDLADANLAAAEANSTDDFLLPVWILALLGCLLASYHFAERNA